jgi:hypothetical protein
LRRAVEARPVLFLDADVRVRLLRGNHLLLNGRRSVPVGAFKWRASNRRLERTGYRSVRLEPSECDNRQDYGNDDSPDRNVAAPCVRLHSLLKGHPLPSFSRGSESTSYVVQTPFLFVLG